MRHDLWAPHAGARRGGARVQRRSPCSGRSRRSRPGAGSWRFLVGEPGRARSSCRCA
ncbi:hypothetical protein QJS66_15445 [Kocuria rhizophila]|nr:hypothetical protein QJS66_15445 [Kocuria rhizophila]